MSIPVLSVVMGVYNGAQHLKETIQSVLKQQNVGFEFIIINDGSTDNSESIVRKIMETEPRIHLINQPKKGLTESLIAGVNLASGEYIARQDVGDISLPNRFKTQVDILNDDAVIMVSGGVSFIGPKNEIVYKVFQSEHVAKNGLIPDDNSKLIGPPHHGSVIFRKSSYYEVGGYRKEFVVAQDLDLWTRLVEKGDHFSIHKTLYHARLEPNSISAEKRTLQINMARIIKDMCGLRRIGECDTQLLEQVKKYNEISSQSESKKGGSSDYYYFLGANLKKSNPDHAKQYFKKSIQENPLKLKSWFRLFELIARNFYKNPL